MTEALVAVYEVSLPITVPSATSTAPTAVPSHAETASSLADLVAENKLAFGLVGLLVSVGLVGIVVLIRSYFALRRTTASDYQPSISLPEVVVAPSPSAPGRSTTAEAVLDVLHL